MYAIGQNHIEPDILLETGNLSTAVNLAGTGLACTFVPEEGAKLYSYSGNITYFIIDTPGLSWPLAVVYRKDGYLTKLSKLFIEAMKKTLLPLSNNADS